MSISNRSFSVILVMILATSFLLAVKPEVVQCAPTVSVPQFSLLFIDNSYDTPSRTIINPYNGSTTVIPGEHVTNQSVEVKIKNQPYDSNYIFWYNIQTKGHFEDEWTPNNYYPDTYGTNIALPNFRPIAQSNSEYTVITYNVSGYPVNSQVDFQVTAMLYSATPDPKVTQNTIVTKVASSGWSSTQTITVPGSPAPTSQNPQSHSPTSSSNPTETASSTTTPFISTPNLYSIIAGLIVVVVILGAIVSLLLYFRHKSKSSKP
jgi:hypothetical protein